MASGYIEYYASGGTTVSNTWQSFLVTTSTSAGQLIIPTSGCRWTSLEIQMEGSSALDHDNLSIMITWDSAGRYGLHGPSQSTYNLNFRTTPVGDETSSSSKKATLGIDLNIVPTFPLHSPTSATAGQVYVWIKGNAVSTNDKVKLVRIHWHELSKG